MRGFLPGLLALALVAGCADELTVEQQLIGTITEMEAHGEEGRRGAFMDMVHGSFVGQSGGMTRDEFRLFMIMQWNRNQRLRAQLFPIKVTELGENRAGATFRVLITGGRGLIPERGQLYDITTLWVRDGSDWLLLEADWTPAAFKEPF